MVQKTSQVSLRLTDQLNTEEEFVLVHGEEDKPVDEQGQAADVDGLKRGGKKIEGGGPELEVVNGPVEEIHDPGEDVSGDGVGSEDD